MKKITKDTLRKWKACSEGYKRFCELFKTGATLEVASKKLIDDGHTDWSNWLWSRCKEDNEYCEQTVITAGDGGTATAGDGGTATTGEGGTATAGLYGSIVIVFYDGIVYRKKSADIDGINIKANVKYKIENGEFVEVKE